MPARKWESKLKSLNVQLVGEWIRLGILNDGRGHDKQTGNQQHSWDHKLNRTYSLSVGKKIHFDLKWYQISVSLFKQMVSLWIPIQHKDFSRHLSQPRNTQISAHKNIFQSSFSADLTFLPKHQQLFHTVLWFAMVCFQAHGPVRQERQTWTYRGLWIPGSRWPARPSSPERRSSPWLQMSQLGEKTKESRWEQVTRSEIIHAKSQVYSLFHILLVVWKHCSCKHITVLHYPAGAAAQPWHCTGQAHDSALRFYRKDILMTAQISHTHTKCITHKPDKCTNHTHTQSTKTTNRYTNTYTNIHNSHIQNTKRAHTHKACFINQQIINFRAEKQYIIIITAQKETKRLSNQPWLVQRCESAGWLMCVRFTHNFVQRQEKGFLWCGVTRRRSSSSSQ